MKYDDTVRMHEAVSRLAVAIEHQIFDTAPAPAPRREVLITANMTHVVVTLGARSFGKSVAEQMRENMQRVTALLSADELAAPVLHEREQRRQLLKNTRGPRAARWS